MIIFVFFGIAGCADSLRSAGTGTGGGEGSGAGSAGGSDVSEISGGGDGGGGAAAGCRFPTGAPQFSQNLLPSGYSLPQDVQYGILSRFSAGY
jgi:hypothetical protein